MSVFAGWENFYVIVGSSAGALIGLQFVVLTLIERRTITRGDAQKAGAAFTTPSVVHFSAALLLSAIMSAPWDAVEAVSALWGLLGLAGTVYTIIVVRRMRIQKIYRPVVEDWLFHGILPFAAYAMLFISAWNARASGGRELYLVAGGALLLLFVGIHNAWDAVTFHVFTGKKEEVGTLAQGERE